MSENLSETEARRTMPVPEAGAKYFGLSRNAAYEAARRGEIPTIRIGRKLLALVAPLERMVSGEGSRDAVA